MKLSAAIVPVLLLSLLAGWVRPPEEELSTVLKAVKNESQETISIFREGISEPVIVQNAAAGFRPFLHPLLAPDGKGVLTEYSPAHHKHQTGIYWGITRINQRDFFHNPQSDYWKRIAYEVLVESGNQVKWQTVYALLDEKGETLLTETQNWTFEIRGQHYFLDLEWSGDARQDLTFDQYDYGGLFVRMPWKEGMPGQVVNAARQVNMKAEGQPAMWIDVGLQTADRNDLAHIALFDHPQNRGFPQLWRVDNQMGVGTAKARAGAWTLKKGMTEVIRHQLMVYTGSLSDIELTGHWNNFAGRTGAYTTTDLWRIAQEEGRKATFLTPEQAVAAMTLKDGYQVNTWASEPMITQPMAFCWDDRGRLWVAENRDYEARGKGFSNSGDSRILILEDTDNDGVADTRKVFLEGIAFPAALAVGFDGVYIGAPPNLLFVPDRDHDDVADTGAIEVRLTGWGIRDRHETLNSLHWGPDGWLYGLQGFATPSTVGKPVGKGKIYRGNDPYPEHIPITDGIEINGGVWRYHPVKEQFEVVAHGFSNPWGIDYDAKGQLFITACVIPHLWHVVPGGIYHRQGGQHFNPYHYSDIRTIADHSHRSAHGGARIYQSDGFPESEQGRIFMANIHEHAILSDVLTRSGSGFKGSHGDDFLMANNAQWVGFSMETGPEGALYVLDWHDADICGSEVLNKETGRIFRITSTTVQTPRWENRFADLNSLPDQDLAALQTSRSDWHARRARLILQNRATKGALHPAATTALKSLLASGTNEDFRLRALWTLHVTGGITPQEVTMLLQDHDAYIRAWAIQLLCEENGNRPPLLQTFANMARLDTSPVVRLYLAAALQRLPEESRWEILKGLITHSRDSSDHNLPNMLWFALEPLVAARPGEAVALVADSKIRLLTNYTARRITDAGQLDLLLGLLPRYPAITASLLEGIRDGLESHPQMMPPANWAGAYQQLTTPGNPLAGLATTIARKFGDNETTLHLMAIIKDPGSDPKALQQAITTLASGQKPELPPLLPGLLADTTYRKTAIRAVAAYDRNNLAQILLKDYPSYTPDEKTEAILTLSSRSGYGNLLTKAIASGTVPKKDVPAYAARQLLRVVGSGFIEVWGPIEQQSQSVQQEYQKYRALLTTNKLAGADHGKGKLLFQTTCAPCHRLFGEGGAIGPDITGANRGNLDYLLSNILDPSGDIQDDYKMVIITTRDGRTYAGNIASEGLHQLTLKVVGQDPVVIAKSNIQSREVTAVSLMPPGLFTTLSDQEVVDLVAYLKNGKE